MIQRLQVTRTTKLPIPEHSRGGTALEARYREIAEKALRLALAHEYPDATILDVEFVRDPVILARNGEGWRQVHEWRGADAVEYTATIDFLAAVPEENEAEI